MFRYAGRVSSKGREAHPSGVFIPGATSAQANELQAAALLPEGSLVFRLEAGPLYEQPGVVTVVEIPSGATLLRLVRDEDQNLVFTHASPGTETREAVLPLPSPIEDAPLVIVLTWSESATNLYGGFVGHDPAQASGALARSRVRVAGAELFKIGDVGLDVMGYHIFRNGELQLRESAIEVWVSTKHAIDIHMRSRPADGFIGEVIQSNLALVMMATGFETYCGRRFEELPAEGRQVDVAAFATAIVPKKYAAAGGYASLADVFASKQIDFGNYDTVKTSFRAAYGIKFASDLGLRSETLGAIKRMLSYRHRIAHVSPLVGFLNQPRVPPQDPVFAGASLVSELLDATDRFVQGLHAATLRLR